MNMQDDSFNNMFQYTSKLDGTLIKGDCTKAWKLYFLFLFTGKQDNMANGQRNIYSKR